MLQDLFDRFGRHVANTLGEPVLELLVVKEQEQFFLGSQACEVVSLVPFGDVGHGLDGKRSIGLIVDGNDGVNDWSRWVGIQLMSNLNRDSTAHTLDLFGR